MLVLKIYIYMMLKLERGYGGELDAIYRSFGGVLRWIQFIG